VHGRLSPQHFNDLLRIIDERPGILIGTVVDLACSDGSSTSVNEMHWILARLFKYGLVMSGEDRRQQQF
jgi:galactose-1-phosphate uridylyltransferase